MPESQEPPFAPAGWPRVVPRIFTPDPRGLVEFMRETLGGTCEYQDGRPAEVWIGESVVMVSDTAARPPTNAFLYVYVPEADAAYARAMAAGCRSLEAPVSTPYGDRRCMVEDRWGNTWQIATRR